jgi:hypothetical protein
MGVSDGIAGFQIPVPTEWFLQDTLASRRRADRATSAKINAVNRDAARLKL